MTASAPDGTTGSPPAVHHSHWSAFYNDPQLADFLLKRWCWHARAGHVDVARRPSWQQGRGTTSAALVHNSDPRIFERLTGMPCSLGLILELLGLRDEPEHSEVAAALRPGLDTRSAAIEVLRGWLMAEENSWPKLIADPQVDRLRLSWGEACQRWLEGDTTVDWQELAHHATDLLQAGNVMREVQNTLLRLLRQVSPPPRPDDDDAWRTLIVGNGIHSKFLVAQFRAGWTASDFAKEAELFQWFIQREKREPGGKFTEQTLCVAQQEWEQLPKDQAYIAKEEHFFKHSEQAFKPINAHLRGLLVQALDRAPFTDVIAG